MGGEYVKYGLPEEITYCRKCTISNQRPTSSVEFKSKATDKKKTIQFNEDGVCDACVAAEVKMNGIDWDAREKELVELCDKHRSKDGSFDCLVPGSGGKDSFYQAHTLKYKYGMNPLTVTWAPALYTDWGWRNHQKWIHAGFNNILIHPNGMTHRLLTRLAVENLYHPFQPFILGQKLLAPKIAQQYDISLIFYGENEAEYGNPIADNDQSKRSTSYFATENYDQVYLGGVSVKELKEEYGVTDQDLYYYLPSKEDSLVDNKIDVRYLGYYLKWHPQGAYYYAVEHGDFEASPERTQGTYSKYNGIDDKIDDLHYYTTFVKFGIGRATYDSSQEIRNGEIDREEGVALVKRFDGEFPDRFIKELYEYMSINEKQFPKAFSQFNHPEMNHEYFMELENKFRSPHLWNQNPDGSYVLKKTHLGSLSLGISMSKHVVIIAEAGVNHNGSLEIAKKLIDVAAEAKADFVKFQTFNTSDLVTEDASMAEYQSKNTGKKQTQYEMLKKLELTPQDHDELISYCEKRKVGFPSTPFGIREADFLEDLVPFFKVPSGELTNHPFLKHLAQKGKAIVMSTGMATLKEVEESVEVILSEWRSCGKPELPETTGLSNPLTLLHCTTSYPTPYDQVNLKAITTMKESFPDLGIGFSDHSLGTEVPVSSVALGATVIEKHFTLDRTMEGPDHAASLEPGELIEMVKGIRIISSALGSGEKSPQKSEVMNKEVARKSLFFSRDLKEGEKPAQSDFTIKRPGDGLEPSMIPHLVTKSLSRDVSEGKKVKIEDFK